MKKALFIAGMLVASQLSNAQQVVEGTNSSWDNPNHSIETYQDFVVTGCTERNPNGPGFWSPMFKITIVNLTNFISFNLDMQTDVDLMDFVIMDEPGTQPTILLTGKTYDQNNIYKMFVAEVDFNGNFLQQSWFSDPSGGGYIPHQIVYFKKRAMIVGTKAYGTFPAGTPPESVPKVGFMLELDANNLSSTLMYQEMDSPGGSGDDYDMLESVCVVPNCGYFATGSANNPGNNEQNLLTMTIDFNGNLTGSGIWDNTQYRYAGASAHYRNTASAQPIVYVLANNSDSHTFEMAAFNGCNGNIGTPFYRYDISSLPVPPGGGIDVNGFRLRTNNQNQVIVTGYITDNIGVIGPKLTPFQMLFSANLNTYLQGKIYGSTNNSPLSDYFDESGASVFINTPDIVAYSSITNKTYVVNPNTGTGYDVNTSTPNVISGCEKAIKTKQHVFNVPQIGHAHHYFSQIYSGPDQFPVTIRPIHDAIICPFQIIANPSDGTGTATIYPNPASSDLEVSLEEEIKEIVVRDMKGNLVMSIAASPRTGMHTTIDISKLGSGVYMIDITDSEGTVHKERFVKE